MLRNVLLVFNAIFKVFNILAVSQVFSTCCRSVMNSSWVNSYFEVPLIAALIVIGLSIEYGARGGQRIDSGDVCQQW